MSSPDMKCRKKSPVVNLSSGATVGLRYIQFGSNAPKTVTVVLKEHKPLTVRVRIDSYRGRVVSEMSFETGEYEKKAALTAGVVGRHALYYEFVTKEDGAIAAFDRFTFDR